MEIFQPFGVHWVGPYEDISGIAHINRHVAIEAMKLGLQFRCSSPFAAGTWSHINVTLPVEKMEYLRQAQQVGLQDGQFMAMHSYPPHYLHPDYIQQAGGRAKVHISYSLFETNSIPANWADPLNHENIMEVWVPCKFQIDSYKKGGVNPRKLKHVPHGVNIHEFVPEGLRMKFGETEAFLFLTIMDVSHRKGPDVLLKAYFEEFAETKPGEVLLVFKGYTGGAGDAERQKIEKMILEAKAAAKSQAQVLFLSGFLSDEQMPLLHRSVHAYINSSRGEGWNFPALQSMACGVPCIMPKHSSHLDFGTDQNCLWIDVVETAIDDPKFLAMDARFYGHSWWEPKIDSLKKQMRWATTHREELKQKGQQAREDVKKFSWENSLRSVVTQLAKYSSRSEILV